MQSHGRTRHAIDAWVAAFTLSYTTLLLGIGAFLHPIPHDDIETDPYLYFAGQILNGQLPDDPFHGLLYPALIALSTTVLGDPFVAARAISTLSLGAVLCLTYKLGKQCSGHVVGALATITVAGSYEVVVAALSAMTDMIGFMWFLLCVVTANQLLRRSSNQVLMSVIFGASLALGWSTRFSSLLALPTFAIALFCLARRGTRVFRLIIPFMASALIFGSPQMVCNMIRYGSMFYDETWRSTMIKLDGNLDFSLLWSDVPYDGLLSVVLSDPAKFVTSGVREFFKFAYRFPDVVGSSILGHVVRIGAIVSPVLLFMRARSRRGNRCISSTLASAAFFAYSVLVCFAFYAWTRFIIVVLPVCSVLAFMAIRKLLVDRCGRRMLRVAGCTGALAIVCLQVFDIVPRLTSYYRTHPFDEYPGAKYIHDNYRHGTTVMSTRPTVARLFQFPCIEAPIPSETSTPLEYYAQLRSESIANNAELLLVGDSSLDTRPASLLTGVGLPEFLQLQHGHAGRYAVYKFVHD